MLDVIVWWVVVELIGLAALPVALRVFRRLPDRGLAFARPLGLLLVSYVFWQGGMLGFFQNKRATIAVVLVAVGAAAWIGLRSEWPRLRDLWQTRRWLILFEEALFLIAFLAWVFYKAYDPDINHTEEPMDFMLLTGIVSSPGLPPNDPWLAGYSISYYYFGYFMMAVLTQLAGVAPSIGYNLSQVFLFSTTVLAAFGVVYNLAGLRQEREGKPVGRGAVGAGLLGALFVPIIGNLEGFLDSLHSAGIEPWPGFWQWLDLKHLLAHQVTGSWLPRDGWWWWAAARVIRDPLDREVIDEFPFFSFMLGDMHPHVMALPIVILAIAMALAVYCHLDSGLRMAGPDKSKPADHTLQSLSSNLRSWWRSLGEPFDLTIVVLTIGALGFLNSWDFPTYALVVALAYALRRYQERGGFSWPWLQDVAMAGIGLLLAGVLFYLPFYLLFETPVRGIAPVLLEKTRFHQYLVIHGVFIFAILSFLVAELLRSRPQTQKPETRGQKPRSTIQSPISDTHPRRGPEFIIAVIALVVAASAMMIGWVTVGFLLLVIVGAALLCWRQVDTATKAGAPLPPDALVLVFIAVGCLMTLVPEFVYIKDVFNSRMNTVFKFYYQGWILLGLASAYGLWAVGRQVVQYPIANIRRLSGWAWVGVASLLVLAGLFYPLMAAYTKAEYFNRTPTLDGMAWWAKSRPDEFAAMRWLRENGEVGAFLVEATGPQYSEYGRFATYSGRPTLLGWAGHEDQWRSTKGEIGRRDGVIKEIYTTTDRNRAQTLLEQYRVRYVIVGRLERDKYREGGTVALDKFKNFMDVAYQNSEVTIYRRR